MSTRPASWLVDRPTNLPARHFDFINMRERREMVHRRARVRGERVNRAGSAIIINPAPGVVPLPMVRDKS